MFSKQLRGMANSLATALAYPAIDNDNRLNPQLSRQEVGHTIRAAMEELRVIANVTDKARPTPKIR